MPPSATSAHVTTPVLGLSAGMRAFTPLAAVCWFAYLDRLPVQNTWAAWTAHPAAVGLSTAAALGEYIADKLPSTPARTEPLGLTARLTLGSLVGAIVATVLRRPILGGIALGALGAVAGTYGGYYARRSLTHGAGLPDLPVALCGDVAAATLAVRSLHSLTV